MPGTPETAILPSHLVPPSPADGLILLDKPAGMTSHDCVAAVRKLCPKKFKVGHGGTLDPFCTGLLVLLLGKGTRLASLFQGMDKSYEGIIRLGEGTDTLDRDGKVVERSAPAVRTAEQWQALASAFIGPQMQIPPAYSAKRVGHERAYALARRGEAVALEPVPVEIYGFRVEPRSALDLAFWVRCSSGTYVRSLAADLGTRAGCPAHCLELRRTQAGPFASEGSNTLDRPFAPAAFIPFDQVDLGLPVHRTDDREERLLFNGHKVPAPLALQGHPGFVKVVGPEGRFIALGRVEARHIQPYAVFP